MADGTFRDTLIELLSHIKDSQEIRSYLARFGSADQSGFAIIKVGGGVLEDDLESLAAGLSLLHSVGLTPIVVHGAGPQLDRDIKAAGLGTDRRDGLRVTSVEHLAIVAKTATRVSVDLAAGLRRRGAAAAIVPPTVIRARLLDETRYGRVGDPISVDTDTIAKLAASGALPIIACVGSDEEGRLVNINADSVARALAMALQPLKIVFVTGAGGLLDRDGEVIPSINLDAELEQLEAEGVVHSGMLLKLQEIEKLLEGLPASSSASITSADGLVRELFTHGGQGTLVRKGERIATITDRDAVDRVALHALLESAFGRPLDAEYLPALDFRRAYIASEYRAAAIVTDLDGGAALMDKFAVSPSARGEGLSYALWRMIRHDEPLVFWRSRPENSFNDFYAARANGFVRHKGWTVFWAGDISLADADDLVRQVAERPASFVEMA